MDWSGEVDPTGLGPWGGARKLHLSQTPTPCFIDRMAERTHESPLANRLRSELEGDVLFDPLSRGIYSTDASIYQIEPLGVVVPRSVQDVVRTVQIASDAGVTVVPRGGGTSQCGQTIGPGIVVDTSKYLRALMAVDPEAGTAVVQPGLVLDHLNEALAEHRLFFPVDVATANRATLGGMAGNNSAGARSIRYGHTVEHVRAIEAVLADGSLARFGPAADQAPDGPAAGRWHASEGQPRVSALSDEMAALHAREADELARRLPRVPRHVAGYNLHRMGRAEPNLADILVGSEGTLAFFTRLEVDLQPLPEARVLGVCHFPSVRQALDAVQHIVTLNPSAVELVDRARVVCGAAGSGWLGNGPRLDRPGLGRSPVRRVRRRRCR